MFVFCSESSPVVRPVDKQGLVRFALCIADRCYLLLSPLARRRSLKTATPKCSVRSFIQLLSSRAPPESVGDRSERSTAESVPECGRRPAAPTTSEERRRQSEPFASSRCFRPPDRCPAESEYGMDSPTSDVLLLSEDDSGLLANGSFSNSSASSSSFRRSPQREVSFYP